MLEEIKDLKEQKVYFEDSEEIVKFIKDKINGLWFKYDLLDFKVKL